MAASTVTRHQLLGWSFRASARTAAHIKHTVEELARRHPGARLVILQPCYNTGVEVSAGTHDKDAVLDFEIVGLDWWPAQRFLRQLGWAAWFRHTGEWGRESRWHIHAISLGYVAPVGVYVPAQVDDYYRHSLGLKGQHNSGADTSWFPSDIKSTVFSYQNWLAKEAAPMKPQPTMLDLKVALERLNKKSSNEDARELYNLATPILGTLVSDDTRVSTPTTPGGVVAALKAKRTLVDAGATLAKIDAVIDLLRPIA